MGRYFVAVAIVGTAWGILFGLFLAGVGFNPFAPYLSQPAPPSPITTVPLSNSNLSMVFNGSFGDRLPTGANWSVTVSCVSIPGSQPGCTPLRVNGSGTATVIDFLLVPNVYYRWSVAAPTNFSASPRSGTVSGSEFVSVNVTFTNLTAVAKLSAAQNATQRAVETWILIVLGGICFGGFMGYVARWRRNEGFFVIAGNPVEPNGVGPDYPVWYGTFRGEIPTTTVVEMIEAGARGERYEPTADFPGAPDLVEFDVVLPWRRGLFDRRGR